MEDGKRICPLLSITNGTAYEDCKKEECAWWDSVSEQCCALSLAGYVAELRR